MDKNRVVIVLVVIVFLIVASMLYVIFASNKQDITEVADVQTFEEGYTFDIDDNINDRAENEMKNKSDDLIIETTTEKDNGDNKSQKTDSVSKVVTTTESSPETGPGSTAAVIALALGIISAGVVYKKQAKI